MFKKHTPLYRQIVGEAWRVTWHQKTMWFFGLFAAFIATGGALEIFSRNLKWILTPHLPFFWGAPKMVWQGDFSVWPMLIMLILLGLGLIIFLIFMSVRSFISLIMAAEKYKADDKIDLDKIWHAGDKKFWSVFGEVTLFKIIIFLAGIFSTFPLWLIWTGSDWRLWQWFYPLIFTVGMVVAIVSSFLMVLTAAYLVLKRYSFGKSLKMAWKLFANHWLVRVEMAVVIFFVNVVFGLVSLVGLAVIAIPVFLFILLGFFIFLPVLSNVAVFLGVLAGLVLIFWVAGFLGAFHAVAWTLLFKRMEEGTAVSKLHRLVNNLIGK